MGSYFSTFPHFSSGFGFYAFLFYFGIILWWGFLISSEIRVIFAVFPSPSWFCKTKKSNCLSLCRVALFSLFCLDSKQEAEPVVRGTKTSNYHLACSVHSRSFLSTKQTEDNPISSHSKTIILQRKTLNLLSRVNCHLSPSKQATSLEMRWMSLNDFQPSQTKITCVCLEFN